MAALIVNSAAARTVLKRTGAVLIGVGFVDIGAMAYCIANDIAYASSFNVFAVIAGVFLMRGSLRAASIVRSACAFLLCAVVAVAFVWPMIQPMDLTMTQLRLDPGFAVLVAVMLLLVCALLGWLVMKLSLPAVRAAQVESGLSPRRLRAPIVAGLGLVLTVGLFLHFLLLDGESANKARALATGQLGDAYRYHVSSLSIVITQEGTKVQAVVTAWNATEVRHQPVTWQEP